MFLHGLVVLLLMLNASYLQARDVAVDKLDKQILEIESYLESRSPTGKRDISKDAHAWKNLGQSLLKITVGQLFRPSS